nr:MAG TPA: hypothetical protein [Caudoviricetes sp.]
METVSMTRLFFCFEQKATRRSSDGFYKLYRN